MMTPYDTKPDIDKMSDKEVVQAIMNRDKAVTFNFLYKKCYPLFKSIYNKYYTDCENCIELINDIYVKIMTPGKTTKKSHLAGFSFRCSLTGWLKLVTENHCKALYKKKVNSTSENALSSQTEKHIYEIADNIDELTLNKHDVAKVIEQITPERYKKLIEYRYLEERSNEETAKLLNMTMFNYYNKHKLAKAKVVTILRKEGLL